MGEQLKEAGAARAFQFARERGFNFSRNSFGLRRVSALEFFAKKKKKEKDARC
jgi:hypothetical protein